MQNKVQVRILIITTECIANTIIISNHVHSCTKTGVEGKGNEFFLEPDIYILWPQHSLQEYSKDWYTDEDNPPSPKGNYTRHCRQMLGSLQVWVGWSLWNFISPAKISGKECSSKHDRWEKEWEDWLQGALPIPTRTLLQYIINACSIADKLTAWTRSK